MRMSFLCLGVIGVTLAGCASVPAGDRQAASYDLAEERAEAGGAAPMAFVLEKDGRTITVFGTTHLIPEAIRWMSPATEAQLQWADLILTETSVSRPEVALSARQQNDMAARSMLPPGETLWSRAGDKADAIRAELAAKGLSPGSYTPLRPWVLCRDLQIPQGMPSSIDDEDRAMMKEMLARFGLPDPAPPDLKIELYGVANGIEAMFLESEYDRALNFSRLSDADGLDCIERSASHGPKRESRQSVADAYSRVLNFWMDGDADGARRWMEGVQGAVNAAWSRLFLEGREALWFSRIATYCDAGRRNCFIAVGFAHLGGPDGLLKGIERLGYRPIAPQG